MIQWHILMYNFFYLNLRRLNLESELGLSRAASPSIGKKGISINAKNHNADIDSGDFAKKFIVANTYIYL